MAGSLRHALDQPRKPDRVRRLDQHRVAGREPAAAALGRVVDVVGAVDATLPLKRFGERRHLVADQDQMVDARVDHRRREPGMERVAVRAKLAHRAEHRDPPRRRRFSAPRLFSVAAIDAGLAL